MTEAFKNQFSLANMLVHFISVVLGIIASLAISSLFIFDARYAPKEETALAASELSATVEALRLEHKSVEAQIRRDVARLEQTNVISAKDRANILKALSKMQSDIAVLIERTN